MNFYNSTSSGLVRSLSNLDPIQLINQYAKNFSFVTSGGTAGNQYSGNSYTSSAWGINPNNENTTFLVAQNGSNEVETSDFAKNEFTIHMKYECRYNQFPIFDHYGIFSTMQTMGSNGAFTVIFYSMNPWVVYPYTITQGNTTITNTFQGNEGFTGPYQYLTFYSNSTFALNSQISIECGNQLTFTVKVLYVVGALSSNLSGENKFPYLVTNNTDTLFCSTDGINWTGLGQSIFDFACLSIAYGNGIWVAGGVGTTNDMAWSTDGINWTGLGIFFSDGQEAYSNIGPFPYIKSWTNGCQNVKFLGGWFVGVGTYESTNSYNSIQVVASIDGKNWSRWTTNDINDRTIQTVTYDGTFWFIITYTQSFRSGPNPTTWTRLSGGTSYGEVLLGPRNSQGQASYYLNMMSLNLLNIDSVPIPTYVNNVNYIPVQSPWTNYYGGVNNIPIFGSYQSTVLVVRSLIVDYAIVTPSNLPSTIKVFMYINGEGWQNGIGHSVFLPYYLYLPNKTNIYNLYDIMFDTNRNRWVFVGDQGFMMKNTNTFSSNQEDCEVTLLASPGSAYLSGLGCLNKGDRIY